MKLIQFESDPPKTKFAPVFDYWVYENFVDIGDLKSIILSKIGSVARGYEWFVA